MLASALSMCFAGHALADIVINNTDNVVIDKDNPIHRPMQMVNLLFWIPMKILLLRIQVILPLPVKVARLCGIT